MRILLSNDDGVEAVGIKYLAKRLVDEGHTVMISAPDRERSAAGHGLTMLAPLYVRKLDSFCETYSVSGTPADCVRIGLETLFPGNVDIVLSGINRGSNMGCDTIYSGTVSAAMEATLMGFPALAVSLKGSKSANLETAAVYGIKTLNWMSKKGCPKGVMYSVNTPDIPLGEIKGFKKAKLATITYRGGYEKRTAPVGYDYYLLSDEEAMCDPLPDDDKTLVSQGFATLSPLRWSFLDDSGYETLDMDEIV